jgi:hypothetical protein
MHLFVSWDLDPEEDALEHRVGSKGRRMSRHMSRPLAGGLECGGANVCDELFVDPATLYRPSQMS